MNMKKAYEPVVFELISLYPDQAMADLLPKVSNADGGEFDFEDM